MTATMTATMTMTMTMTATVAMMEITHQVDRDRQMIMETTAMMKTTRRVHRRHRLQNESEHMVRQAALVPVHRRGVRHTSSGEDEPTWTGHPSSSSTSRVRKRRTSTEPESAEPSARKRQAIRKGKQKASDEPGPSMRRQVAGKGKQKASESSLSAPSSPAYSSTSSDDDPITPFLAGPSARRK